MSLLAELNMDREFIELVESIPEKIREIDGILILDPNIIAKEYFENGNVADVSIDPNANVNGKSPVNFNSEIGKPLLKIRSYYLLWKNIRKRWGLEEANSILRAVFEGLLYFHDITKIDVPYSYHQDTSILVRINGREQILSMKGLMEIFEDSIVNLGDREQVDFNKPVNKVAKFNQKYGSNVSYEKVYREIGSEKVDVEVFDGEKFVGLKRVLRHKRHNKLLAIETGNGRLTVVTEDHPVILEDWSTKLAKNIKEGDKLFDIVQRPKLKETINISKDLAYLLGFIIGDGFINKTGTRITIDQKERGEIEPILDRLKINYKAYEEKDKVRITINETQFVRYVEDEFGIGKTTYSKKLPKDIINWNKESIIALISGIIDAEGTQNGKGILVRMSNLGLLQQVYMVLRALGCKFVTLRVDKSYRTGYKSTTPVLYKLQFTSSKETEHYFKAYSYKMKNLDFEQDEKMIRVGGNEVSKIVEIDGDHFTYEYVYDITTTTGTFLSGGLLQHNCFAPDVSNLMFEGRPYGWLPSVPPKRLQSFVGQLIEMTMDFSQENAGAIGIANALVNMAYFTKDEEPTDKEIENYLQQMVHVFHNTFRIGGDSPFTNISLFDRPTIQKTFEGAVYPDGSLITDNIEEIMRVQKIFAKFFAKGQPNGKPYRFPVTTINIRTGKDGKIIDKEFFNYMADLNRERCIFNWHIGEKIASCCRLTSDLAELKNQIRMDSFGNGGLSIGSHRVVTINLHRVALMAKEEGKTLEQVLSKAMKMAEKLLIVHKKILKKRVESGVLKFFNIKWADLKMFFSTFGFTGLYDAYRVLEDELDNDGYIAFGRDTLLLMESIAKSAGAENEGYAFNVEEVPAENSAPKLAMKDNYYYNTDLELLSNQMIPLYEEIQMFDRLEVASKLMNIVTGGAILHLNVDDELTVGANRELTRRLIEEYKIPHFAINKGFSTCINNHTVVGIVDKCPECGGEILTYTTRVVGFFTDTTDWIKQRREYEFPKRKWYGESEVTI